MQGLRSTAGEFNYFETCFEAKSTALQIGVLDEQVIYFLVDHIENKQEELEAG